MSPDGETIVFDYLGDLFTIPIAGGDATQLTSGMAFDAQPRFSPDGSRIAYTSDADGGQNIWIRTLDGSETKQISKGDSNRAESPEWMPDGDYVVAAMGDFRGRGLPKLKLFHVNGGSGIQPVSEPDNLKMIGPAVSPDGRYIWYSRRTGDWTYGGKIRKLPIAGGNAEEIPFRVQFDLALGPRVDFDYPIEDTPTFTVRQIRDAAPSPSGDHLAFTALDRLWVSGAGGSHPERLTAADMSEHFAAWSPDGEWIAYSTWNGNAGHLFKARADGSGNPVRLTRDAAAYFAPAWGPEDRIVALRGPVRAYETQGEGGARGGSG